MALTCWTAGAVAQTAMTIDGVVESTAAGFEFPDGSMQSTAVASAAVEDTGQTTCSDEAGSSRPCAETGEDGEHQAGVAWPTPRFTANGDGTVTDHLTQLLWLKDANCPGGQMTWQDALDWIVLLNTTSVACTDYAPMTFTDWRLPNIKELVSLTDFSQEDPALPASHPFSDVQGFYWSSSSSALFPENAWYLITSLGNFNIFGKTGSISIWPVRGGE